MRALGAREQAAHYQKHAASESRFPAMRFIGSWSYMGISAPSAIPTYQYQVEVDMPLFTSGRIRAQISRSEPGAEKDCAAARGSAEPDRARGQDGAGSTPGGAQRSRRGQPRRTARQRGSQPGARPLRGRRSQQRGGHPGAGRARARQRQPDCRALSLQPVACRPSPRRRPNGIGFYQVRGLKPADARGEMTMIEVEVGLENFDKMPVLPEPPKNGLARGWANAKLRLAVFAGAAVLLLSVAILFVHYRGRESTDDAQVDGHIAPVASKVYGNVTEVLEEDNQPVKAGQVLVRIDPRDYQASLDKARAALALAESQAAAAQVGVPWTRETTQSGNSNAVAQLLTSDADFLRARLAYEQATGSDLAYARASGKEPGELRPGQSGSGAHGAARGQSGDFTTAVRWFCSCRACGAKRTKGGSGETGAGGEERRNRPRRIAGGRSAGRAGSRRGCPGEGQFQAGEHPHG